MSTEKPSADDEGNNVGASVICDFCQSPIPADEMVQGNPIRLPSGEPVCLDCHTELEEMHRKAEEEGEAFDPSPKRSSAGARCGIDLSSTDGPDYDWEQ